MEEERASQHKITYTKETTYDKRGNTSCQMERLDHVTTIGNNAFHNCSVLETLDGLDLSKIPHIPGDCFDGTKYLKNHLDPDSECFIYNGTVIRACPESNVNTVHLPPYVTSIGDEAFMECEQIQSVTGLEHVTSIGDSAFMYCTDLRKLTGLENLTQIGCSTFWGCENLTGLEGCDLQAIDIGEDAFSECPKFTMELPQGE